MSNQAIYETIHEMMVTSRPSEIKKMNPDLPVLLISEKKIHSVIIVKVSAD